MVNDRMPMCCEMSCGKPAEWEIIHGTSTDDCTHACEGHIWALLTDARKHQVHSLIAPNQSYAITREPENRNMLRNTPSGTVGPQK